MNTVDYIVKTPLKHDDKNYAEGELITLDDAEIDIQQLLALGAIEPVKVVERVVEILAEDISQKPADTDKMATYK